MIATFDELADRTGMSRVDVRSAFRFIQRAVAGGSCNDKQAERNAVTLRDAIESTGIRGSLSDHLKIAMNDM